jgi:putative FmdB family regulatory protein
MPIYEYRCSSCGHQQEFLQKVSDPPRTHCTKCGQESLAKMVTAAGFQLKGSGWYATDFKGGASKPAAAGAADAKPSAGADGGGEKKDGGKSAGPACGSGACPACQ